MHWLERLGRYIVSVRGVPLDAGHSVSSGLVLANMRRLIGLWHGERELFRVLRPWHLLQ